MDSKMASSDNKDKIIEINLREQTKASHKHFKMHSYFILFDGI